MGPCLRVVFREVGEDFGWSVVFEASQPRVVIARDEVLDEGVSLGV